MPNNRSKIRARGSARVLNFADTGSSRMDAEELLNEIDNLALLLHQVKKQTDRVEAAADAIGDAILSRLDKTKPPHANSRAAKAKETRSNMRLPTMPSRAMQLSDIQL